MKRHFGWLLVILLTLLLSSSTLQAQTVTIPESVAAKIIDDLIIKDHLEFVVNTQDSIINVYKAQDETNLKLIKQYKLNEEDYKLIIKNKDELHQYVVAELADSKKKNKILNIKNKILGVSVWIAAGLGVLLTLLLTQ